ncbi:hypothetical protein C8Q78DRAFT_1073420 [Trametes maxima]|nr:hypothetical protein C8Q78DRAFT_1073420 [Trametes maxima]
MSFASPPQTLPSSLTPGPAPSARSPPKMVPVHLPGQNPMFPTLFILNRHIKAPDYGPYQGRIYFTIMKTDPQHLTKLHEFLKEAKIPNGTEDGIAQSGFAQYGPGDCLIGRDPRNGDNEEMDELLSWITPVECFDNKDVADLWAVRNDILGPDELRTPAKAVFQDGVWSGGVAWERDPLACCVQNASRCYTAAFSHQVPKTLTSPTRGVKTSSGMLTPHHVLRKRLIDVTARIGVHTMTLSAPAEATLLRQRAEALNFPRIGNSDNYYFSTMQLNITPAQGPDAATAKSKFVEDLGHFGGKHTDNGDTLPAFSHLLSCSDLRGNERPGIFVLLTFGLYIVLDGFVSCCFSGRHFHGGFPPHAQPGCIPDPRSYRVVIISYPSSSAFDAASKYTLANAGNNVAIELPREAIDPRFDNVRADVTPTSIAADGHVLTSADALMNYLGRALAQLAHKIMGEVCSDLQVSIDTTQFLQSISYVDPSEPLKRLQLRPWDLAPQSGVRSEAFGCTRQDVVTLWNNAYRRKLPFFPESSDSGLWAKYRVFLDQPLDVDKHSLTVAAQKGKSRAHPAPVNAGKKGRKRGRANSDLVNVNNIGRVQTIRSITFNNPASTSHMPTAPPPPTTPHRHSKRARAQNPGSSPDLPLRQHIKERYRLTVLQGGGGDGGGDGGGSVADNELDTDGSEKDEDRDKDPDFYPTASSRPHLQLKKTKGPIVLSSRKLAKLLAPLDSTGTHEEDDEECMNIDSINSVNEQEDPPYLGLRQCLWPHLQWIQLKFLEKLSLSALEKFRTNINRSIVKLEKERPTFLSTSTSASRTMYQVLHHSGKPAQFSADYGSHLATLWTAVNYQKEQFTFHEYPEKAKEQTVWLTTLLKDIHTQLLLPEEERQPLQSSNPLMHDFLVKFTREALLLWLRFPSGQGQLQAGFIRTLLQHFHNPDVLLLPGMHDVFSRVRGSLLPSSLIRGSQMGLNMLNSFSNYLSTQPLAKPGSPESVMMKNISERLEVFRAQWRQLEGSSHVLPAHIRGSDLFAEALQATAHKLATFLRELLPLLSSPLPAQLSPLQHKHAPEIQNAFSDKGILHPTRINEPGVIASLWLLCGIFYRTRFSSEHADSLLFRNYDHWQETYKRICADPQIAAFNQDKDHYFCNARAYGQATTRSTENAQAYFEGEPAWLEMFKSKEPGWRMPYIEAYRFMQRVQRGRKILPQLGPLTGMLITADLVYAGKVAMPSVEEMGEMVHLLDRGASACLRFFRLLDKSSNKETVQFVFTSLYDKVYASFTEAERSAMTFDPIMFEHCLCKYQRCVEK